MSIQVRVPREGGEVETMGRTVWMDPQRDIAHAMVTYLGRADSLLERKDTRLAGWCLTHNVTEEDRQKLVSFWGGFIRATGSPSVCKTQLEALEHAKYLDVPINALMAGGYAFMMTVFGAYFTGARQAVNVGTQGDNPNFDSGPMDTQDVVRRGWFRCQLRSILVWLVNKL